MVRSIISLDRHISVLANLQHTCLTCKSQVIFYNEAKYFMTFKYFNWFPFMDKDKFGKPRLLLLWPVLVLCIGSNLGLKFGRARHTGSDQFLPVNAVMKG